MSVKRIMNARFCLSIGAALSIATVLGVQRNGPVPTPGGAGAVYVYFPSLCEKPGDATRCEEIRRPDRPSFESMEKCTAHADDELKQANNPRMMASCLRQREV